MKRHAQSHKGDNGRIAVIGGSTSMHGAPLLSSLSAEASGCDLVYVFLPHLHQSVARNSSLNFIVHPFVGNDLTPDDTDGIVEFLATLDCAVIGPGLARDNATLNAMTAIISEASCDLVLDASALQKDSVAALAGKQAVLTPHLGELERMELAVDDLHAIDATFLVKGVTDTVVCGSQTHTIDGGNAGLTVGGTGDCLAGLVGGLIAQGVAHSDACIMASTVIKRAGSILFEEKGYAYTAADVVQCIPKLVKSY